MPQGQQQRPLTIFEVINLNINTMNENIHTLMQQVAGMQQEIANLRAIFSAPEQPNAHGEEGAKPVSSEHKTIES